MTCESGVDKISTANITNFARLLLKPIGTY